MNTTTAPEASAMTHTATCDRNHYPDDACDNITQGQQDAETAMALAAADLECDLGVDLGECAMTRERRAAANGTDQIADCLIHGKHAAAERAYTLIEAGAIAICRGGPTADCGNTAWHSSHFIRPEWVDEDGVPDIHDPRWPGYGAATEDVLVAQPNAKIVFRWMAGG